MFLKSDASAVSWYCSSPKQPIKHRHTLYSALPTVVQALSTVNCLLIWKQITSLWRHCWSSVLGCPVQDVVSKAASHAVMPRVGSQSQCGCMVLLGSKTLGVESPHPLTATCPAEFCAAGNTAWTRAHLFTPTSRESSSSVTGKDCDSLIQQKRKPSKFLLSPQMPTRCSFLHLPLPLAGSNLHSLPMSLLWGVSWAIAGKSL